MILIILVIIYVHVKKLRFVSRKPFHVARLHRKQTVGASVDSKISTSVRQSGYLTGRCVCVLVTSTNIQILSFFLSTEKYGIPRLQILRQGNNKNASLALP